MKSPPKMKFWFWKLNQNSKYKIRILKQDLGGWKFRTFSSVFLQIKFCSLAGQHVWTIYNYIIGNFKSKPFYTLVASNGFISLKKLFIETITLLTTRSRMTNIFAFTLHCIILTKFERLQMHMNNFHLASLTAQHQVHIFELNLQKDFTLGGRSKTALTRFWLFWPTPPSWLTFSTL